MPEIHGVSDSIAFELGVIWRDGDNDVSEFFVGKELGEFHRHELFDGLLVYRRPVGGFCDVGTGNLGVVRDNGGIKCRRGHCVSRLPGPSTDDTFDHGSHVITL